MTNRTLALSYLKKANDRLDVLDLLYKKRAFSDVIREAQEVVELSLKSMLRFVGVEPPKIHDVGVHRIPLGLEGGEGQGIVKPDSRALEYPFFLDKKVIISGISP